MLSFVPAYELKPQLSPGREQQDRWPPALFKNPGLLTPPLALQEALRTQCAWMSKWQVFGHETCRALPCLGAGGGRGRGAGSQAARLLSFLQALPREGQAVSRDTFHSWLRMWVGVGGRRGGPARGWGDRAGGGEGGGARGGGGGGEQPRLELRGMRERRWHPLFLAT